MKNTFVWIFLATIVLLGLVIRVYHLDQSPPALNWDEAAVGYNAWTIANFGKDEYGKSFPLVFKSFGEDKNPVHIYITALFVKILGLSDFSTRFPTTLFGVFNIGLIFFLARFIFKSQLVGLAAAFMLAVSPHNIHFSRFDHELNFMLFFFMLGLLLFLKGIKEKNGWIALSVACFGLSMFSYNAAKVVVPLMFALLVALYFKQLWQIRKHFLISLAVFVALLGVIYFNPNLLGTARAKQTAFSESVFQKTASYQKTHNLLIAQGEITLNQYLWHFTPKFLYLSGDKNPRLSTQASGEFYPLDLIFLLTGVITLLWKRTKIGLVLLAWALVSPLPSALVNEAPHAARASFMIVSWTLIAALGFYTLMNLVKSKFFKISLILVALLINSWFAFGYLKNYYLEYPKRYAHEWQYGMKQATEYVQDHQYSQVYVTDVRSQPYIFFLYHLKVPLDEFLKTAEYSKPESNNFSYNTVSYFEHTFKNKEKTKFYFGSWDPVESKPDQGVLYVINSSQADGLKYKDQFRLKKPIYFPNGTVAFYLVSLL